MKQVGSAFVKSLPTGFLDTFYEALIRLEKDGTEDIERAPEVNCKGMYPFWPCSYRSKDVPLELRDGEDNDQESMGYVSGKGVNDYSEMCFNCGKIKGFIDGITYLDDERYAGMADKLPSSMPLFEQGPFLYVYNLVEIGPPSDSILQSNTKKAPKS